MSESGQGSFELIKAVQEPYAFTVKKLGGEPQAVLFKDYEDVIDHYKKMGYIKDIDFEYDDQGRLHIHGIILLRKGFYRKKLCMKGYHIKLEQIYDEKGWLKYIHKSHKPDCNASEYKNINLFKV